MSQIIKKFVGDNQIGALKARLENNSNLRARNAADSADINLIKADASDIPQLNVLTEIAADPVTANGIARKSYVDAAVSASAQVYKKAVRLATITDTALTGGASLTVDGVASANGDRILLAGNTAGEENGIYDVSGIGTAYALTRSSDADASAEVIPGMGIWVAAGNSYNKTLWVLNTLGTIVLDTTSLEFIRDTAKIAKENLTLNGTDITNQYKDLGNPIKQDSLQLFVSGVMQVEGSDYTLSVVSGVTRITFAGDLATGGAAELVSGDILHANYHF